jgi:hypothetical protein
VLAAPLTVGLVGAVLVLPEVSTLALGIAGDPQEPIQDVFCSTPVRELDSTLAAIIFHDLTRREEQSERIC